MAGEFQIDALLPADMAAKAEQLGVRKATMKWVNMFALSILAGAFISLGAIFATTVTAGSFSSSAPEVQGAVTTAWPAGFGRLLGGVVFTLGLILVIVGGAELFTGNNLIVMAWANRKVSTGLLLKNWGIVYAGNFVGALLTVAIMFFTRQYAFNNGAIGMQALSVANTKSSLDFVQAIALGIMCNALVCMAVWLTYSARTTTDKILAIIPPIAAFVAAGFEHSIANMYFIPLGLAIKYGDPAFYALAVEKAGRPYASLDVAHMFVNNLIPVTIGNIIGGAVMVGVVYWFVYLRPNRPPKPEAGR
jgi:formate/nitrite transporter